MAAEVATSPSQTSAGAGGVGGSSGGGITSVSGGVAGHSSGPKSPFQFNSPTSSSIAHAASQKSISSPQQQYLAQSQSQSLYKPTGSPSDDASNSSYFSSHRQQRLSPSDRGVALPSPAPERSIPRGLPPMMTGTSPANSAGGGPGGVVPTDPQLPMSPGSIAMALGSDNQDALPGDLTAPRKRSKVSRACDECRRKKVGFLDSVQSLAVAIFASLVIGIVCAAICALRVFVFRALGCVVANIFPMADSLRCILRVRD
jgi:hypothetical protein